MTFKEQFNIRIQQLNSAEKLILINVVCFVLPMLIKTVLFLFNISSTNFCTLNASLIVAKLLGLFFIFRTRLSS